MQLTVETISAKDEFERLAGEWSELLARAVAPNVFLSHEWLYTWWDAYSPDGELRLLTVRRGQTLLGVAPMYLQHTRRAGIPVRLLRFVGDGTSETDHMHFLVDASEEDAVCRALLDAIDGLDWDVAAFNQMPREVVTTDRVTRYGAARGWPARTRDVPCPYAALPGRFDDLLGSMPSRFRSSLRSSRRRLQAEFVVEFGEHDTAEELPAALEAFFDNHASRWSAKGEKGVFGDGKKRRFYQLLAPKLLARDWLRFYYLKADGRIVAQQFCFGMDGVVMLLQEGFDYDWAKLNVGNTLRSMVFERLIEQGYKAYDFLAGTSRHKKTWAADERLDARIAFFRGLRGRLSYVATSAMERARSQLVAWRPGEAR